jgi:WD40 repeat protein/serine/threonine protein kinase/tetratricopeptide (TPR) repeat protein
MALDAARAKSLFLNASDLADPAERAAYLERECGGDAELRGRVEALLRANDAAPLPPASSGEATVDSGAGEQNLDATGAHTPQPDSSATTDSRPQFEPGLVIASRYTLVEKIGEGGMGEVWVAKQTEPVKRKVALKLIKTGMDSKAVLARFEQERQALALMDHPNIARVLDGGMTPTGQPFFVMELVNGLPLNKFCDEMKLTPRQRLELFVPICQAVQHAHQKGIVHRDLKPANILITMIDAKPVPKVIDFGVAKATSGKITDESMSTQFGAIVGTLEYMSPEQAGFSGEDIDTRADIYSLGVILYELLTGLRPLDAKRLKKAGLAEMIRLIREEEPSKPSTRLSTDESLPSLAALRQTEPKKLMALLRGELDWVVMKCLEKQRERRYETANALNRDIQRYLADEVVEARPPSASYRLKKFVRRHKGRVIAASVVLLVLLGGMIGTSVGLVRADREREKAEGLADQNGKLAVEERDAKNKASELAAANANLAESESKQKNKAIANADDLKYQLGVSSMVLASAAYDNHDVVLAAERLEKVPVEQRGWEWRFLKQQTRGGLFTLRGHTAQVLGVAFSPDGERIVTAAGGGRLQPCEVKLWDARTGTAVLELNDLPQPLNESWEPQVFSLSGTRLASAGRDNTARVWDARTGKLQWELKHTSPVVRVWLSPDGSRVVTNCPDGTVKVWDAETGKLQWEFKGIGELTGAVGPAAGGAQAAFSPDGTRIFIGFLVNKTAKVWDARTGKPLLDLTGYNDDRGLAFSPDGKRIVAGGSRVKVWDAEKGGPPLLDLGGLMQLAASTTFSPDGTRILIGGIDGMAKVLDARTGTPLFTLKTPQASGPGVGWFTGWGEGEQSASFSPDGTRIVTVSGARGAHVAKVWDARTGAELFVLQGHTNLVFCAAFGPDGEHIVTGSLDATAKVWDARTGTPRLEMGEPGRNVYSVAVSPDGMRIVAGGGEFAKPGKASVWDARTGTPLLDLKGVKGPAMRSVAFSRDGTRIVTGGDINDKGRLQNGEATVWDARTGAALLDLKGVGEGVSSVSFSPDGMRIVTAGHGTTRGGQFPGRELKVWDAQTGAVLFDLTMPVKSPGYPLGNSPPRGGCVAFSSDGTRFVAGGLINIGSGATEARVWDASTGTLLLELKGRTGIAHCVAFSPDGTRIVTGGGDTIDSSRTAKVWEVPSARPEGFATTGTQLTFELKGHTGPVVSVAFSPDGERIITGSEDRTVRVWDARTGTTLLELSGFRDRLTSVAFSPDGTRIVTGEFGGTVTVWDARVGKDVPDGEELAYRRLHTQPNPWRYRAGYEAARAARDDFAARFYLKLLLEHVPPAERPALEAKADLDNLAPLAELVQEYRQAGKRDQALPLLLEIVTVKKARLGHQDPDTLNSVNELGVLYWQLRQYDKSIPVFEDLVKIREVKHGRDHLETLIAVANLGVNCRDAGRLKEAIPLLEEAHRAAKKYRELRWVTGELLATYAKAGEKAKVGDVLQEQVTEARTALPPDSPDLAGMLALLGQNLLEQKKWDEAEPIIREALTIREKSRPDAWTTFNSRSQLGGALLGQTKYAEAEPLLLKGYEGMKQREQMIPPEGKPRIPEALDRLIDLYTATDKPDEVKKWRAERAKYPDVLSPPRDKK